MNIFSFSSNPNYRNNLLRLLISFTVIMFIVLHVSASPSDSLEEKTPVTRYRYVRLGLDLAKLTENLMQKKYKTMEFQLDYRFRKELLAVLEGGYARSTWKNAVVDYQSSTMFFRIGVDQFLFRPMFQGDMDNAIIGVRYGIANVNRSTARYQINDPVWGISTGQIPSDRFLAHWAELNAGFRLEVVPNLFFGWNFRLKAMLNSSRFVELPPAYLGGYGSADRNSTFGYNAFLLYGLGKRNK